MVAPTLDSVEDERPPSEVFAEAMAGIKRGALAAAASIAVQLVGGFLVYVPFINILWRLVVGLNDPGYLEDLAPAMREAAAAIITTTLASVVLLVYSLYRFWLSSSSLARLRDELGVGALGGLSGMVGAAVYFLGNMVIVGALWRAAAGEGLEPVRGLLSAGVGLALLGDLLRTAGLALVGLMFQRIENLSSEEIPLMGSWKTAGSTLVAGAVAYLLLGGLLGLAAALLVIAAFLAAYVYADETLRAMEWSSPKAEG